MKSSSTILLRITILLIGAPIVVAGIFWIPGFGGILEGMDQGMAFLKYPFFIGIYAAGIPFFFALYQSFKLLKFIDQNIAFSELSVKALWNIKYCAMAISGLYALELPILYFMAQEDDAPGLLLLGIVIVFASVVIAAFAAVLHKLLKDAIDIKSENDLTV